LLRGGFSVGGVFVVRRLLIKVIALVTGRPLDVSIGDRAAGHAADSIDAAWDVLSAGPFLLWAGVRVIVSGLTVIPPPLEAASGRLEPVVLGLNGGGDNLLVGLLETDAGASLDPVVVLLIVLLLEVVRL